MQPDIVAHGGETNRRATGGWPKALASFGAVAVLLMALAAREWREMAYQWWNIATYSHILLIPAILVWLAWQRRGDLAQVEPLASWAGVVALSAAFTLWLTGRESGLNLLSHAGAVGMAMSLVPALLGTRAAAILALPLGMMAFLVPFGDELVPALQAITAELAIALTHWSGVPARIDGIYIDTPAGLFIVAEACSGVRFLVAAVALGVLVCFTAFDSWTRRAAFLAACVVVPILANGVRAWGTIYVAQSRGVEFAAGFDHIVYGWIFFALVLALLLGGARPFFQRTPEDAGLRPAELDHHPLVRWLARFDTGRIQALVAIAALAGAAAIATAGADG